MKVPRTSNKIMKEVVSTNVVNCALINYRTKCDAWYLGEKYKKEMETLVDEEKRLDPNDPEMGVLLDRKKSLAALIEHERRRYDDNHVELADIDIHDIDTMVTNLDRELKTLDDEILSLDDENDLWIQLVTVQKIMKNIHAELQIRDAEVKQENINSFMKNVRYQRNKAIKKDNNKIFNIARADAENRLLDLFRLEPSEIADLFSSEDHTIPHNEGPQRPHKSIASWNHIIKGRQNNVVPLSPGIKVPKIRDKKSGQLKDFVFTLSSFFSNKTFVEKLNNHYNPLGLELTLNQDKKFKNKWWFRLAVVSLDHTIKFKNGDMSQEEKDTFDFVNSLDTKVTMESAW